jgi:DNA-binding GntR family transcriptional regulator
MVGKMKNRIKLKDRVYSEIKTKIMNFDLKPGQKIYENEIANALGVSRTPIREALSTLLQEGLVTTSSSKGYFISEVSSREIEELYEIRENLETLAIHLAMQKSKPEDWERMEQELDAAEPGKNSDKPTMQLFEDSHRFHQEIAKLSGNRALLNFLNTIADKMARTYYINILFLDRAKESHNEHVKILQFIKAGDEEKAIVAAGEHFRISKEGLLHLIEQKKNLIYIV